MRFAFCHASFLRHRFLIVPPCSRYLAKKYLKLDIQMVSGHDSAEECVVQTICVASALFSQSAYFLSVHSARTALKLALLKIERGPQFGLSGGDEAPSDAESLLTVLSRHRRATAVCAPAETLRHLAPPCASAVPCADDGDAVRRACTELSNRNDLVWVNLSEWWLSVQAAFTPALPQFAASPLRLPDLGPAALAAIDSASEAMERHMQTLLARVAPNTVVLIVSGHAPISIVRRCMERKLECARLGSASATSSAEAPVQKPQWSPEDEAALVAAQNAVALGMLWARVV